MNTNYLDILIKVNADEHVKFASELDQEYKRLAKVCSQELVGCLDFRIRVTSCEDALKRLQECVKRGNVLKEARQAVN